MLVAKDFESCHKDWMTKLSKKMDSPNATPTTNMDDAHGTNQRYSLAWFCKMWEQQQYWELAIGA